MDNTRLYEFHPAFEKAAVIEGFDQLLMNVIAAKGSFSALPEKCKPEIPQHMVEVFRTSHEIAPEWHVRMQAAFQKHTDNAVSKTINFPAEATVEDVEKAYMMAYDLGCKGITVYRDGSKDNQVLSTGQNGHKDDEDAAAFLEENMGKVEDKVMGMIMDEHLGKIGVNHKIPEGVTLHYVPPTETREPRSRPVSMTGVTERVRTGHGNMYVTVNFDEDGKPFEVFGTLGKAGGCNSANLEAISRMVSLALQSGIEADAIVKQLRGIICCPVWDDGVQVKSVTDALALVLSRHVGVEEVTITQEVLGRAPESDFPWYEAPSRWIPLGCPDCSSPTINEEGCTRCTSPSCGWSRC